MTRGAQVDLERPVPALVPWALHLSGLIECPTTQSVALALDLRGCLFEHLQNEGQAETCLIFQLANDAAKTLQDLPSMLDLIEDLHPHLTLHPFDPALRRIHRVGLDLVPSLHRRLLAIKSATDPQSLDLDIHFLRSTLTKLERVAFSKSSRIADLSNLDIAVLPVLWQLNILDRAFGAGLLAGFDYLQARCQVLLLRTECQSRLNSAAEDLLVQTIRKSNAVLAQPDLNAGWFASFGRAE